MRVGRTAVIGSLVLLAATTSPLGAACPPPDPGFSWCDQFDPDGIPGTGDESPGCRVGADAGWGTPCTVHSSTTWRLGQAASCTSCASEWYVRVACGRQFEMIFGGTESARVQVFSVDTGLRAPLVVTNECARRRFRMEAPFTYCDDCAFDQRLMPKETADAAAGKPAGSCTATLPFPRPMPELSCLGWHAAESVEGSWNMATDFDGDGSPDGWGDGFAMSLRPAPCASACETPDCHCGFTTSGNTLLLGQRVYVRARVPAPGVYRIRVEGGGPDWTIGSALTLHDACSLAEAEPAGPAGLPQLAVPVDDTQAAVIVDPAGCPASALYAVTACNDGDAPATTVPIRLIELSGAVMDVDLAAHPTELSCQGPLLPGECRTCTYEFSGLGGMLTIDPLGVVPECCDDPAACPGGPRELWFSGCDATPSCSATALLATPDPACVGATVGLDASSSSVSTCGGVLEVRFEKDGALIPGCDWSTSTTCDLPVATPGTFEIRARARCSALTSCESESAPRALIVHEPAAFASAITATAEGDCGIRLSWDPSASASPEYSVYRSETSPVALDAAHRVAEGLSEPGWLDSVTGAGPYLYRVEDTSSACGSVANAGGEIAAEPAPLALPGEVLVVPEGECALRVSWTAATAAGSVAYDVYRAGALPVPLDAAHRIVSGTADTTWLDTVPWGAGFSYRVEAVTACRRVPNAGGDSDLVSPSDTTDPEFAGIVNTRDMGGCQVEVTWEAGSDACSGIAGYNVYRDHGVAHAGETLVAALVAGSPHVDETPGNGTWVYVVRAVDLAGNEEPNVVFQQESEGSCTNDFPADAGMDGEEGIDAPNADRLRVNRGALADGLRIRWHASDDERGLYPVTYAIYRGSLRSLRTSGYTHGLVEPGACGLTLHEYIAMGQDDGEDAYYLVAVISGDNSTFGYDSHGGRIPGQPCP